MRSSLTNAKRPYTPLLQAVIVQRILVYRISGSYRNSLARDYGSALGIPLTEITAYSPILGWNSDCMVVYLGRVPSKEYRRCGMTSSTGREKPV